MLKYIKNITLFSTSFRPCAEFTSAGTGGLILLFLTTALNAQVSVRTQLDTNYILIGDQMRLNVQVSSNSNLKKVDAIITATDTTGSIEFLDETAWQEQAGSYSKSYTFTSFDSGYYNLLPLPVVYQSDYTIDTAYSNGLGFMVDNPTTTKIDSTIADIKPIIKEPTKFEDYIPYLIGFGVLLLLAGLIWFFFFRKKEEPIIEQPIIFQPAHEIALEKLSTLKEEALWQKGEIKNYYSKLTFIFREYLENRFDIQALESTSEEIINQLEKKDFDAKMNDDVQRVLQSADLVKFAKAKPMEEFHVESLKKLENVIDSTQSASEGLVETIGGISPKETISVGSNNVVEVIKNAENHYASFRRRLAGYFINAFAFSYTFFAAANLIHPESKIPFALGISLFTLMIFAFIIYNFIWMPAKKGGSIGKQVFGMRVVNTEGENISFGISLFRQFLKSIISPLPILLGFLMYFFNKKRKTLHDLISGTVVLKIQQDRNPIFSKENNASEALYLQEQSVRLATFRKRLFAYLIDLLIMNLLLIPLFLISYIFPGFHDDGPLFGMFFIPFALISYFLLFVYLVSKKGGTPGKLALGLRLVDEKDFEYLSILKVIKRGVSKLFLSGLFFIGFLFYYENKKRQTWQDQIVKSIVIEKPEKNNFQVLDS